MEQENTRSVPISLEQARLRLQISQKDAAKRAGITQGQYSKIERGVISPGSKRSAILSVLHVTESEVQIAPSRSRGRPKGSKVEDGKVRYATDESGNTFW